MAAIDDLMAEFENRAPDEAAVKTRDFLNQVLSDRREMFVSHIESGTVRPMTVGSLPHPPARWPVLPALMYPPTWR
ncbi:MAG: hypothetical protein U5K27_10265 [Desulfotignum sp.]|nr:hypothetical protein [Desulfotignum sp.]